MRFVDRVEAGRRLADRLSHLQDQDVVVLGLPRGGVPVAVEVARSLRAPLDVIVVRKIGVPFQPELAMGAVGEEDTLQIDPDLVCRAQVSEDELAELERRARSEVRWRAQAFREGRPRVPLTGRTVVVVDDGIATGSTARVACQMARAQGAARVVLAAPVCARESAIRLQGEVDELDCIEVPEWFSAVGRFYVDFQQTSDEEVVELLRRAAGVAAKPAPDPAAADPPVYDADVEVGAAGPPSLPGHLTVPEQAQDGGRVRPRQRQ